MAGKLRSRLQELKPTTKTKDAKDGKDTSRTAKGVRMRIEGNNLAE